MLISWETQPLHGYIPGVCQDRRAGSRALMIDVALFLLQPSLNDHDNDAKLNAHHQLLFPVLLYGHPSQCCLPLLVSHFDCEARCDTLVLERYVYVWVLLKVHEGNNR
jgi:hypothetical protein